MRENERGGAGKAGLVRALGLGSALCVIVGGTIGSAVFLVASDISKLVPSPLAALSVWVVGGALSLFGGLTFAELGAMYPGAGGQYVYLREAFGRFTAFLYGWTLMLVIQTGAIAAVATAFAKFSAAVFPIPPGALKPLAAGLIITLSCINLLEIKKGAWFLDAVTSLKILALAALALAGMLLPARAPGGLGGFSGTTASAYGVALIAAFWGYEGWTGLCFVAGEVKEPQRNVPLGLGLGIAAVGLIYVTVNLAYYRMLPVSVITSAPVTASAAASVMGGAAAVRLVGLLLILSALGSDNAVILAGPRVIYAMAEDGNLPAWLAYVHPKQRVPTNAMLLQMVWAVILVLSGRYEQLFTYVMCASLAFYALTAVAVIHLRRTRPDVQRPYRVPLYPWLPAAYILSVAAVVLNTFFGKPLEALAGLGIVLLGVPVYLLMRKPEGVPQPIPS